ncbi:MAG: antitoxin Xre-like helix-turn-helix domain-containing protein [Sedimenticola sp.]
MSTQRKPTQKAAPSELAQLKAGLKAFFRITESWKLNRDQRRKLLGSPGTTLYTEWKAGDVKARAVSTDLLDRLSYILGVYKALKTMHSDENQRLFLTNAAHVAPFNDKSPLQYMLSGHLVALADVRRYLDYHRGV